MENLLVPVHQRMIQEGQTRKPLFPVVAFVWIYLRILCDSTRQPDLKQLAN